MAKDKLFGLKLDPNTSSKFDALSSERKLEVIEGVLSALKPVQRRQGYEDEIAVSRRNLEYERDTTVRVVIIVAIGFLNMGVELLLPSETAGQRDDSKENQHLGDGGAA